jgi:hypothetical protein
LLHHAARGRRRSGNLAAGSDKSEPLSHSFDLSISTGRHELLAESANQFGDLLAKDIDVGDHRSQILASGDAIVLHGGTAQVTRQRLGRVKTVQVLEQSHASAGVGGNIDDAHLLTGGETTTTAILGNLVGKTDLA